MNFFKQKTSRIKNMPSFLLEKDFSFSAFSYFILGIFLGVGILLQLVLYPRTDTLDIVAVAAGTVFAAGMLTLFPLWSAVIQFIIIAWIGLFAGLDTNYIPLIATLSVGLVASPSFQLVYHWDKVVTLRMGHFRKVHGPGLFVLIPLLDRVAEFVDTRIRATDFSAEKCITQDTVPVHVDALAFWMIWDAKKAILEVENFVEAVVLSAQTALRDSIGKHDLSSLLSERDELGKEIQKILDAKTNPWGITILSIEFTDIIIPRELEDSMSKRAQAERERQSRIILGSAEVEVARKFEEAAKSYENNPTALQLRAMNMVYEGLRQKGSLMLLPSSALDNMNLGTVMGSLALNDRQNRENADHPEKLPAEEAPTRKELSKEHDTAAQEEMK